MFDELLEKSRKSVTPVDPMRVVILNEALKHAAEVSKQAAEKVNADVIMHKIENVLQS